MPRGILFHVYIPRGSLTAFPPSLTITPADRKLIEVYGDTIQYNPSK
jgi:hypothetical protein